MSDKKLNDAVALLGECLIEARSEPKNKLRFAALAKAYETAFEYAWKSFKRAADINGLEVYSPRDSLKAAAQLKLIDDLELWDKFLNVRNLSVHDYLGVCDKDFLATADNFHKEAKRRFKLP